MKTVLLALGTNLGDRAANLEAAVAALEAHAHVTGRSGIYETRPWGGVEQGDFLNMVVQAETALKPLALLRALKRLERRLGRMPAVRYGPRLIDLDILFYADLVMESSQLTIPHPRLAERAFVLVPLAELAPGWVHPVLKRTVADLLRQVDREGVRRYEDGA